MLGILASPVVAHAQGAIADQLILISKGNGSFDVIVPYGSGLLGDTVQTITLSLDETVAGLNAVRTAPDYKKVFPDEPKTVNPLNLKNFPKNAKITIVGKKSVDAFAKAVAQKRAPNDPELRKSIYDKASGKSTKADEKADPTSSIANNFGNLLFRAAAFLLSLVKWLLLVLTALAGKTIDFILSADFTKAAREGSSALVEFWRFTRDALNFVFILTLLVIAFATIAGLEGFGARRMLPKLLFAALLVNFSLSIGVNIVKLGDLLCRAAASACAQQSGGGAGAKLSLQIANAAALGSNTTAELTTITALGFKVDVPSALPQSKIDLEKAFTNNLVVFISDVAITIVIGIFAAAFIALAAMLLARLVVLFVLLVLSPAPYALSLVPAAAEYANRWWSSFLKYVIFLPVTVFFLALAARLMGRTDATATTAEGPLPIVQELGMDLGGTLANTEAGQKIITNVFQSLFMAAFILVAIGVGLQLGIYGAKGAIAFGRRAALWGARGGPVGSALWRRTGAPFLAARKRAQEEMTKERTRTGLAARLGTFAGAPLSAAQRARTRRRLEDEEVKDLKARGVPLQELKDMPGGLTNRARARYALDNDLIRDEEDFKAALGVLSVGSPEFNKGAKKFREQYPIQGTDFVVGKKEKRPATAQDYNEAFRGLSTNDAYDAVKRKGGDALLVRIRTGEVTPTVSLARGIKNAADYDLAKDLAQKRFIASPGGPPRLVTLPHHIEREFRKAGILP